jgi:RNA polymerase sigma-70 factor (family 1)
MSHTDLHNSSNALRNEASSDGEKEVKIIDEEILIKRVFDENPKLGCEVLFQKYYTILCSHAIRFVYSKEVAEDIVSDIFCRFWSDQIYLAINISYRAYLFKAVRFSSYNYIKWELSKRRNEVDFIDFADQLNSMKPEEIMVYDELAQEIDRLIENLPTQCKRVFMLSRFENKKYQEIANELNISIKAVEAHISKALQTLRNKLKSSDLLSLLLICHLFQSL